MKENKNKLAGLTVAELQKREKTMKGVVIGSGIVALLSFSVLLFLSIKNKKPAFSAAGISCMITLLPGIIGLSQVNAELKSRQSDPE